MDVQVAPVVAVVALDPLFELTPYRPPAITTPGVFLFEIKDFTSIQSVGGFFRT